LKSCCVIQDHYDDDRDKIVPHKTTPDVQDQDRSFWSQTGLVLRPTVSDHIIAVAESYPATLDLFYPAFVQ